MKQFLESICLTKGTKYSDYMVSWCGCTAELYLDNMYLSQPMLMLYSYSHYATRKVQVQSLYTYMYFESSNAIIPVFSVTDNYVLFSAVLC